MSPQCQGKTLNGKQCSRTVPDGEQFCYQHQPTQLAPQPQLDRLQDQLYAQLARLSHAERLKFITGFVAGSIAEGEIQAFWEQLKVFVEGLFSPGTQAPEEKDVQQIKLDLDEIRPGANLRNADLSKRDLHEADLRGANLSGADLSWARLLGAVLSRADLSRADLSGAHLSGADLSEAKLIEASLYGAQLSGADLSGANLSMANLSGAHLSRAHLVGADLYRANLSGAILHDADLSRARLDGTDMSKTTLNEKTILPDGKPYDPRGGLRQLERFTNRPINE